MGGGLYAYLSYYCGERVNAAHLIVRHMLTGRQVGRLASGAQNIFFFIGNVVGAFFISRYTFLRKLSIISKISPNIK